MNELVNFGNRLNGGMSKAVKWLLIVNIAVFVMQQLFGRFVIGVLGLSMGGIQQHFYWQFFTYMFVHASFIHIFFNMLMLFALGPETERGLGTKMFAIVYAGSGLLGGIMWILLGNTSVCVGASGSIYGILGAYAALWPNRRLVFWFIPQYPIRAWKLVCGLAIVEFLLSLAPGIGGDVAHLVHLVGVAVGIGMTYLYVHRQGRFRRRPRLRVVQGGSAGTERDGGHMAVDAMTVDRLLDKIAKQGMGSLTKNERAILESASRQRKTRR